jgi:hypothetical protein
MDTKALRARPTSAACNGPKRNVAQSEHQPSEQTLRAIHHPHARHSPTRRDNTLATSISSDASNTSRNPHEMDDLDAAGPIYFGRLRLRALWTAWSVVVRVHFGAPYDAGSNPKALLQGSSLRRSSALIAARRR